MASVAISSPPLSPLGNNKDKRVSFGDDHTFVYEKEDDATPLVPRQPFTEPDAPVSRVVVTSDTVIPEAPSPIPPPAQFEEVRRVAVSPPLPSKTMDLHFRKMTDAENPFRPEEILYHEVDPIVEQYLHKPFPPSRPGSAQNTPTKQQHFTQAATPPPTNHESPLYLQNGLSKEQLVQNEKNEHGNHSEPLLAEHNRNEEYVEDLPPAGKVELIHVKKKKCGCCSVQ
ncbi:uncharacterized protein CELE_W05B5.1 [Caenorhabditis elegans]|uniref:Uncharacterized protein n=4 Tax=Caenorhabditis elegans TaxID=6239 RepID=F5GUH2_CAEEL|nr:Uncharacterized protein CELE_W05B5.1 [Caenorhabditis elegans]CCA65632.1 Uncharacterized protein CELE_W05B5.1 [Caenorhabditis elegans]|eukprot:NP_001252047.1 Uncharacterized protein CELE_W05B5.1 [Caenorhabditis elegans]